MICMCISKKKKTKQVLEPTKEPSRKSKIGTPSHQASSSSPCSYSTTSTLTTSISNSTFYKDSTSQSSLVTSRTSISSLCGMILDDRSHYLYEFREICYATRNFLLKPYSSSSSSTHWHCKIRDQRVVVVQRRVRRRFDASELMSRLSVICKSHHSSLVKLRGISVSDGNHLYLVYDYIPGDNLANCLRNSRSSGFTVLSSWISRIKIAYDLAHGLDYVHNCTGLGFGFVHNHLKSSSVIIAEPRLDAKICHFGTSELCGEIERDRNQNSGSDSNKFEGTRGYMAPEFQKNAIATQKCDIYAFGVVILELISGMETLTYRVDKESGGFTKTSVVEVARRALRGGLGEVRKFVDKGMRDSYPVEVVVRLVRLALDCVVDEPESRPDMGKVVLKTSQMLLESQKWSENIRVVSDFSVSLAPR